MIAPAPETARIRVEQLGFSRRRSLLAYGVELVNVSYEHDALDVTMAVRLRDAHGSPLGHRSLRLRGVSAATTSFVGGSMRVPAGPDVQDVAVAVRIGASGERRFFPPVAADIGLRRDRFGRLRLTGRVTASTSRLTGDSVLYAVVFDDRGRIIGGGEASVTSATGTEVAPGQTAAFELRDLAPTPARRALFAGVSVEA